MKKILVTTDFSKNSNAGMIFAAELAKKAKAKLHLFNVVVKSGYFVPADPMFYTAPPASLLLEADETILNSSLKNLEAAAKHKMFKGIDVTYKAEASVTAHQEILFYADKIKADLTIISSRGSSGLEDIFLGSTAERVVRFAERPVVIIPSAIRTFDMKTMVFASDFEKEAYKIFPFVKDFASIWGSEVHLLKVNTDDQFMPTFENRRLIDNFNKHFKSNYPAEIYDDFMKDLGIIHYSDEIKAGIIAIGSHGKKGLARFFSSDVSGGMIKLTHKPVLVVNFKAAGAKRKT